MRLFRCNHRWKIVKRSNALQLDDMGYPLRLVCCECTKCGKPDQMWVDVDESELKELDTGESVLVKWK